ncbi:MAG: hypothetical protein KatS3mg105_2436 [Gemmatales bacterium]|nr:MAG: hypothetical protein KatS3mg105_2436 [Gemmatales bacterium]
MVVFTAGNKLDIARELFDVMSHVCFNASRGRRRQDGLKEIEFYTLSILHERGTMNVGDIQRILGVLPAQMSRIIRALETAAPPLVQCGINPNDKRKIDVHITEHGVKALNDYRDARVSRIAELLHDLNDDEQENITHLLFRIRELLERG